MSDCTTNHARLVRLALLMLLLGGCASRHVAAVPPGHDAAHPALTPVGKGLCHAGVLKLFGSYGWRNCKNEEPKDFNQRDYYGDKPIDPPYCIVEMDVYMPNCPWEGGHLMRWKHKKWVEVKPATIDVVYGEPGDKQR